MTKTLLTLFVVASFAMAIGPNGMTAEQGQKWAKKEFLAKARLHREFKEKIRRGKIAKLSREETDEFLKSLSEMEKTSAIGKKMSKRETLDLLKKNPKLLALLEKPENREKRPDDTLTAVCRSNLIFSDCTQTLFGDFDGDGVATGPADIDILEPGGGRADLQVEAFSAGSTCETPLPLSAVPHSVKLGAFYPPYRYEIGGLFGGADRDLDDAGGLIEGEENPHSCIPGLGPYWTGYRDEYADTMLYRLNLWDLDLADFAIFEDADGNLWTSIVDVYLLMTLDPGNNLFESDEFDNVLIFRWIHTEKWTPSGESELILPLGLRLIGTVNWPAMVLYLQVLQPN